MDAVGRAIVVRPGSFGRPTGSSLRQLLCKGRPGTPER
jgi:hypothetical protein